MYDNFGCTVCILSSTYAILEILFFAQLKLQRWNKKKISVLDMTGPTPSHEHMDDPQEVCVDLMRLLVVM